MVRKRGLAFRVSQHDRFCSKRAGSNRISRAEQTNHRYAQCGCKMQWAGVTTNEQTGAAGQGYELRYGAAKFKGISAACLDHGCGQSFFSGSRVHQSLQTVDSQSPRHLPVTLGWPLLCPPTGARIDDDKAGNTQSLDFRLRPASGSGVMGKFRGQQMDWHAVLALIKMPLERLRGQAMVLFNHVVSGARELFRVEEAGGVLARIHKSGFDLRATQGGKNSRLYGPLKVEGNVIAHCADRFDRGGNFFADVAGKHAASPALRVDCMDYVDHRAAGLTLGRQQLDPSFFHQPANRGVWKGGADGSGCG